MTRKASQTEKPSQTDQALTVDPIERSIEAFRNGQMAIIVDDAETAAKLREPLAHRSGLVGTVDELKAVVEEYEAVGVHEVIVPDFAIVGPDKLATLERFHTDVLGG